MANRVIPDLLASKFLDRVSWLGYDNFCHDYLWWQKLIQHSFGFRRCPNFSKLPCFRLIIESSWKALITTLIAQYGARTSLNYDNMIEPRAELPFSIALHGAKGIRAQLTIKIPISLIMLGIDIISEMLLELWTIEISDRSCSFKQLRNRSHLFWMECMADVWTCALYFAVLAISDSNTTKT